MSENWTVKQALEEMISLWERIHPGVALGKPTLNRAKRALKSYSIPPTYAQGQEEMRERAADAALDATVVGTRGGPIAEMWRKAAADAIRALPIKEGGE